MENNFYEIYLKNYDKTLIYCNKQEYKGNKKDKLFTNMYIYGDDTLIEVINKIKIGIIDNIEEYSENDFEKLSGFLSAEWNYYSEFKKNEYLSYNLNIDYIDNKELVIGFYDSYKNYNYYISKDYFLRLIDSNRVVENEYTKTINQYINYNNNFEKINITKLNFELNTNEFFIKYNNFKLNSIINKDIFSNYSIKRYLFKYR